MTDRETIAETATHRLSIVLDEAPHEPDGDGQGYIFDVPDRDARATKLRHRDHGDPEPSFDLADIIRRYETDWQMVGRYLRAFHDVVSFDYASSPDATYVAVVTRAQVIAWGLDPSDTDPSYSEGASQADLAVRAASNALTDWTAYAEGDTWVWVIEEREQWTSSKGDEMTTWEHVDSCGGFFGRDYAEEAARDAFSTYTEGDAAATA